MTLLHPVEFELLLTRHLLSKDSALAYALCFPTKSTAEITTHLI